MEYSAGRLGRVFVLKFANGDDFRVEIERFAEKERIRSASIVFLGAFRSGHLVTGPKKPVIPPDPNWTKFGSAWEAFGVGTIFRGPHGIEIHAHTSMGKRAKTLTGCVRKSSSVFIVIEAVVFEIKGVRAHKDLDPRTGITMLMIGGTPHG